MNDGAGSGGPSYWLDLFTPTTWAEFVAAGATVSGFRQHARGTVSRIRPGDLFLCYVTGVSRYVGLLEVVSESYSDTTTIWAEDTFPVRLRVKPAISLDIEEGVPVVDILPRFSWYASDASQHSWSGHFRRSPKPMTVQDGEMVADALRAAQANPVRRDVAGAKLRRAAFTGGRPPREPEHATPWVAEAPESLEPPTPVVEGAPSAAAEPLVAPAPLAGDDEGRTLVEVKAHTEIEGLLLELGSAMGLQLWLDRSDRGQLYGGRRLGEIPGVVDTLPVQFSPEMVRRIERIDVLWLRDEAIIAAFEVEATTAVYSGLLRMADLLALSPNLNIPLFIVAPEERRGKVREEISRPTFSRALRKPLARSCRYISFSRLREDAARLGTYVRVVKPEEFVEALSESFDNGA